MSDLISKSERFNVMNRNTGETIGFHESATITHNGRDFTASGAHVDPDYAVGYLKFDSEHVWASGIVTDWQGNKLGSARIVSSWRINSYMSTHMHQVECVIDGVRYTGRSCGSGMIWKGKRKAR